MAPQKFKRKLEEKKELKESYKRRKRENRRRNRLNVREKKKQGARQLPKPDYIRKRVSRDLNKAIPLQVNDGEHYIGKMDVLCNHCEALHFAAERIANKGNSFNDCCSHGAVNNCIFDSDYPNELILLFEGNHLKSNVFFEHIRSYNSAFSFASFNANLVNYNKNRRGPYCFKIQGQIYYQINTSLYAKENEIPKYGQLFIMDTTEANKYRMDVNNHLDCDVLSIIDKIIRDNNIFAKSYNMMREEVENQKRTSTTTDAVQELQMKFSLKPGFDKRTYNPQRVNEVAAIFSTTADGEIPESYVTIRNKNTGKLQYVSSIDPNVEQWIYPLFYPYGVGGWNINLIRNNSTKRISRSAYVKNLIAIRGKFNPFLRGRRLFQQWIVDNYVKVEKDRVEYCRNHQKQLRSESYQGLVDYLKKGEIEKNARIGKIVILPSSFISSPRNMAQNYQDAMAIVRKTGKPDLFITMTCNPKWKEIKENLLTGQETCDRPDIVARVFNLKKDYLMHLIVKQSFFGEVSAYVYVVEFQKRGLPHVHILLTLKTNFKFTNSEIVNRYISAEIPDPNLNPVLHSIVMQNMIHGPCGDWCLINNKCSKNYPKEYQSETIMDVDCYPYYKREDTGKYYNSSKNFVVDNRYVVPHNQSLLLLFNCHINVEVVSSIKAVKYLYKYIYKGYDAALIKISESLNTTESGTSNNNVINHDEIKNYIDARYVGPVEACWRILSKKLYDKSHAIIRLPVHLPNQQNLMINDVTEDHELQDVLDQKNMFLDYFSLNERNKEAQQYLYVEIPSFFVFKKNKFNGKVIGRWEKRKSYHNCIGRMYAVSPSQTELFHLRLLLLHKKNVKSFEDLRTINGRKHQTFTEACIALGLIDDDHEWNQALQEGEVWMMPKRLRRLYVRILIYCNPLHPEELWNVFKDALSEDYYKCHKDKCRANIEALQQINNLLQMEGKSLKDYAKMPEIKNDYQIYKEKDFLETAYNKGMSQYNTMNIDQKKIIDEIMNCVETFHESNSNRFYIDGPGGSGKTYIYNTLWHLLIHRQKIVSTMAFTGIAATLLPNGKTAHKVLGLPVPLYQDSISSIKLGTKEAKYLEKVNVFIWDEAPMAPRYALECMDRLLKFIMNNDFPFGGKIIVLGGDHRQLLPVLLRGTRIETLNLSIKRSYLWNQFKIFELKINMRALPEEKEFIKFLLDVGEGILNDNNDNITIPSKCIVNEESDIIKYIYGNLFKNNQYKKAADSAILSARNIDVDEINKKVVDLLDKCTEKLYTSIDSVGKESENDEINEALLPEYLNSLTPTSIPPHELYLRQFCVVMLMRNLSINEGLCNGTRLLILELKNHLLRCEILTGDKAGEIVFLNRITFYCENEYPFTLIRRQFPIKVAFAMTINKSQGQTFEKIGIDLRKDVFNHGQLYVALSRVRSLDSLKIYIGNQRKNYDVKNYVYKEILM